MENRTSEFWLFQELFCVAQNGQIDRLPSQWKVQTIYTNIYKLHIYVAVWMAPKSLGKPQLKNMSCLPNSVSFFKQFWFNCSCLIHGWCCEYYFKRWKHVIVHVVTSPWPSQKRSHLQLQSALLKDVWIEMTGGLGLGLGLGRIIWTAIFNFGVRCSSDHRGRCFPSQ